MIVKNIFPSDKIDFALLLKVTLYKSFLETGRACGLGLLSTMSTVATGQGIAMNVQSQHGQQQQKWQIFRSGSLGDTWTEGERGLVLKQHVLDKAQTPGFSEMFLEVALLGGKGAWGIREKRKSYLIKHWGCRPESPSQYSL
jgi:hypothetical protein